MYEILVKDGYNVSLVQEPETSFNDDVAATKRVLALQGGPSILVAHSYGGAVITEAGTDPSVVGLVYIAAHMPDAGEKESDDGKPEGPRQIGRIHQAGNRWIRARCRNYGSPLAVSDKNARPILLSEDALRGSHILFKRRLRLLDDADVVAVLDENVVNAFPARAIGPCALV